MPTEPCTRCARLQQNATQARLRAEVLLAVDMLQRRAAIVTDSGHRWWHRRHRHTRLERGTLLGRQGSCGQALRRQSHRRLRREGMRDHRRPLSAGAAGARRRRRPPPARGQGRVRRPLIVLVLHLRLKEGAGATWLLARWRRRRRQQRRRALGRARSMPSRWGWCNCRRRPRRRTWRREVSGRGPLLSKSRSATSAPPSRSAATWAFVAPPLIAACLGTGGVGVPGAEDKTLIAGDTSLAAATPSAGSVAHIAASAQRLRTSIAKVALAKPSGSCHKTSGVIFRLSAIQKPPSPEERSRRTNEGMNAQRNEESMMAQACANARRTRKTRQCANIASCKARHIKRSTIWQTYEYPETKGMRA